MFCSLTFDLEKQYQKPPIFLSCLLLVFLCLVAGFREKKAASTLARKMSIAIVPGSRNRPRGRQIKSWMAIEEKKPSNCSTVLSVNRSCKAVNSAFIYHELPSRKLPL